MAAPLKQRVLERINAVQDPCSLAQAIPIGLSDMGLVTDVRVADADAEGRHDIALVMRVTAPGCLYMPFMDRSIRAAVADLEEVGEITTEWDPEAEWSPSEIAAPARKRIDESRAARRRELSERSAQGSPSRG
jgi:metal-sulfur cluster biosynthetic enzyme